METEKLAQTDKLINLLVTQIMYSAKNIADGDSDFLAGVKEKCETFKQCKDFPVCLITSMLGYVVFTKANNDIPKESIFNMLYHDMTIALNGKNFNPVTEIYSKYWFIK